jgi:hypothetical protein
MIVGGDINNEVTMKILGLGDVTDAGKVVRISRDGVTFEKNGAKVVLTLADVESMVFSN